MTKLQEVKNVVIRANESIRDLVFGCRVNFETQFSYGCAVMLQEQESGYYFCHVRGKPFEIQYHDIKEILGRPIRLADVLYAIESKHMVDSSLAYLRNMDSLIHPLYVNGVYQKNPQWNLLKDNLDSQDTATIDFLHGLLVTNPENK